MPDLKYVKSCRIERANRNGETYYWVSLNTAINGRKRFEVCYAGGEYMEVYGFYSAENPDNYSMQTEVINCARFDDDGNISFLPNTVETVKEQVDGLVRYYLDGE